MTAALGDEKPAIPRIHRENLEKIFARVWAVAVAIFGGQWLSIAIAEDAGRPVIAVSLMLLVTEICAAACVLRSMELARRVVPLQLAVAGVAAAGMIILAGHSGLPDPRDAVGDGLLLLLFPALASHVAFGPPPRLAAAGALTAAVGIALAQQNTTGTLGLRSIPYESSLSTLANLVLVWGATRLLRHGALEADVIGEQTAALAADQAAAQAATTAERNAKDLVHDVVIHSLFALSQSVGQRTAQTTLLIQQAIEELEAPLTAEHAAGPPVDIAAEIRALVVDVWAALPIICESDEDAVVPSNVAWAVRGVVNEALRNVLRHAQAEQVRLSVSYRDGLVVVVQDDGIGFDVNRSMVGHRGISGSITERMLSVGGVAVVSSTPGVGTTVTAQWAPERVRAPEPVPRAATPWSWVERLRLSPRLIWATYFAPELSVTAVFAFVHLRQARNAFLAMAVLFGLFGVSMVSARVVARFSLSRAKAIAMLIADAVLVCIGIGLIQTGTQDGYAYWATGGGLSAVTVIAVFRPLYESIPVTLLLIGLVDVFESAASTGATIGANVVLVFASATGLAHRVAFARLTPVSDRYLAQLSETRASAQRLRVQRHVEERRIAPIRERILPFLRAALAADGSQDPISPSEAAKLLRWTRWQLSMPGFLTDRISDLIAAGEAAGLRIEVSGTEPEEHATALGRRLLEETIGLPGLRELKLSLVSPSSRVTDVFLMLDCGRPLSESVLAGLVGDDAVNVSRGDTFVSLWWRVPSSRRVSETSATFS